MSQRDTESDFTASASDDDIDQEAEELVLSKEFQESVIKYVKLDDLTRKKQDEIKELKKMRKPCEEFIITYLENIKIDQVDISDGKLQKKTVESKVPISNKVIRTALSKKIEDPAIVSEIIKLVDDREKKTKVNIKRVKTKLPHKKSDKT